MGVCFISQLFLIVCDPVDCSPSGSSVHGISRQEYWSELPFLSSGDLPDPGIEPVSPRPPALRSILYPLSRGEGFSILKKQVFFLLIYICVFICLCVFKHSLDHSVCTHSHPAFSCSLVTKLCLTFLRPHGL